MQAALKWQDPPLIHVTGSRSRLGRRALAMKRALHAYEGSLCSCGHSRFLTLDPEHMDDFSAEETTCWACAESEAVSSTEAFKNAYPGTKLFTRYHGDDPTEGDDLTGGHE